MNLGCPDCGAPVEETDFSFYCTWCNFGTYDERELVQIA